MIRIDACGGNILVPLSNDRNILIEQTYKSTDFPSGRTHPLVCSWKVEVCTKPPCSLFVVLNHTDIIGFFPPINIKGEQYKLQSRPSHDDSRRTEPVVGWRGMSQWILSSVSVYERSQVCTWMTSIHLNFFIDGNWFKSKNLWTYWNCSAFPMARWRPTNWKCHH